MHNVRYTTKLKIFLQNLVMDTWYGREPFVCKILLNTTLRHHK